MKNVKKFIFILLAAVTLIGSVSDAFAMDMHFVTGLNQWRVPIPRAYNVSAQIGNIGDFPGSSNQHFRNPSDIFVDSNDYIYIVDTGNNRIVKMNPDLETVGVFTGPSNRRFSAPQGVFVDSEGSIFVADTGNSRIVHLCSNGEFVEQFVNPESEALGAAPFAPTSLVVNNTGQILAVRGETIMILDANNEFRGLFGQSRIGFSITEALLRVFATEQQLRFMSRRLAPSFIDIHLGVDGMVYATNLNREEGEVQRLNSVGNNTFRTYRNIGDSNNPIVHWWRTQVMRASAVRRQFRFGEYFDDDGYYMEPVFVGITTDRNGIITIVEEQTGRMFQYDQEGNLLAAFGGIGPQTGLFSRPSGIAVDNRGRIFVTDRAAHNFQVFEPTEFIQTVHGATTAFNEGMYDEAYALWNYVLDMNENYELAHLGISRVYYKQERYAESMARAKLANEPIWYSRAFEEYRYEILRANFGVIVLLILAGIVALRYFFKYYRFAVKKSFSDFIHERKPKMSPVQGLFFSSHVFFHPIDTFEAISVNKKRINVLVPIFLFLLAFILRIVYIHVVHYPLAPVNIFHVNIVFEAIQLWIVPASWVIASYFVSSIANGESKLDEIFFASALAFVPFIFINTPMMFISNVLSDVHRDWFGIFASLSVAWMGFVLLMGFKILNDYNWKQAIKLGLVSVFVMLMLWLVGGIIYVLSARLVQFIIGVVLEFRMVMF